MVNQFWGRLLKLFISLAIDRQANQQIAREYPVKRGVQREVRRVESREAEKERLARRVSSKLA